MLSTRSLQTWASKSVAPRKPTKGLTYIYSPQTGTSKHSHALTQTDRIALANPLHPFHIRTKRRLATRDDDQAYLVWRVVTTKLNCGPSAVVRNTIKRRIANAFRSVLDASGFRVDGTLLTPGRGRGITGRLNIFARASALTCQRAQFEHECSAMLATILSAYRR